MATTQTDKRRIFELTELDTKGYVTYEEINTFCKRKVTHSSIGEDVNFLNKGESIARYIKDGDRIRDRHKTATLTSIDRRESEKKAKTKLAELMRNIIVDSDYELQEAVHQISESRAPHLPANIILNYDRLRRFWELKDRKVVIDSGTTNYWLSEELVRHQPPRPNSGLVTLEVTTNSTSIITVLSDLSVKIRTQIIGGTQQLGRTTISGDIARNFVTRTPQLHWDIAVIGVLNIDTNKMELQADNYEDVEMKRAFLAKSELKFIVADASKIDNPLFKKGICFAPITPSEIDFIVLHSPQKKDHLDFEKANTIYKEAVNAIQKRGIPVIEADKLMSALAKLKKQEKQEKPKS